jgi:hypothetical protein
MYYGVPPEGLEPGLVHIEFGFAESISKFRNDEGKKLG